MDYYFPFDKVRQEQNKLMEKIDNAIKSKRNLLIHAPTGLGKTAASLAVALKHAIEKNLTIFFITPKHTQHKIAIDTLKIIKEKYNLNFHVVDLLGKKWMCSQSGVSTMGTNEFAEYCKTLKEKGNCEYCENMKSKENLTTEAKRMLEFLEKENPMHVEHMVDKCTVAKLCPFEMACELGKKATVIIGDYYHVLSPSIRETIFLKMNKKLSESIIIIDESHNLPEKCRSLLSNSISTFTLRDALFEAKGLNAMKTLEDVEKIQRILEKLIKNTEIQRNETLLKKEDFLEEIKTIDNPENLINEFEEVAGRVKEVKKKSSIGAIAKFLEAWPGEDEGFVRILAKGFTKESKPFVSISYNCLDPGLITGPMTKEAYSVIAMSGTLRPLEMYDDVLAFDRSFADEFESPFPEENKVTIIVPDTTTKFTSRSAQMYNAIANYCVKITDAVPGNSVIFFPSYSIRDEVNKHFSILASKTVFMERSGLTKEEKEEILENFKSYNGTGAVLLAASSGSMGEGIDLPGDLLKCVVIVGVPLSPPDLKTQALINYYNEKFGRGWDYGYTYPAILKTFQNAGRCIRSETDKGVVVFLDERYAWDSYLKCFPKDSEITFTKQPQDKIRAFFGI
ncbi:ATP-dependent DNA helicase [Candidatus Woesearchaeota archaeon]|nr:ATP-dependent DNA helicase [Candidatus Woesearchaeota archaeon]